MGRRSCRKARKVRIVRGRPDEWKLVDEETGIEFKKFDSFEAAKRYCVRRDYDFGQFGRAGSRAKTAADARIIKA